MHNGRPQHAERCDSTVHALLECPECGRLCRPRRNLKDGGVSYLCRNKNEHADFRDLRFRIDGDGELHF